MRSVVCSVAIMALVGCATTAASDPASESPGPGPVETGAAAVTEPTDDAAGASAGSDWYAPPPTLTMGPLSDDEQTALEACLKDHDVTARDVSAEVLMDAAACLQSVRAYGREILMYRQLVQRFPDAPQTVQAHHELGLRYEQIDDRRSAATTYEDYLRRYPKQPDARESGQRAVCLLWSVEGYDDALAIVDMLEALYGRKGFTRPEPAEIPALCAALPPVRHAP